MCNLLKKIFKSSIKDTDKTSFVITEAVDPNTISIEQKDNDFQKLKELDEKILKVERLPEKEQRDPNINDLGISVKNPFTGE